MNQCPCCFNSKGQVWHNANVWRCNECGYVGQINVQPFEYGKKYLESYRNLPVVEMSWLRLGFIYRWFRKGSLLDIGYGDGEFIRQANKVGFKAKGYDAHQDDIGVPIVTQLTDEFDCVTMFDSWEHMSDLTLPLKVDPRWFFITVPYLMNIVDEEKLMVWKHYKPNEHLHYFTYHAIIRFFSYYQYEYIESYPLEDIIRRDKNEPNTMTYVFKKVEQ